MLGITLLWYGGGDCMVRYYLHYNGYDHECDNYSEMIKKALLLRMMGYTVEEVIKHEETLSL